MSTLLVPISNGFEEIEALTIVDVCRRADIEVTLASINEVEIVGAHNITIKADALLKDVDADAFDMIALPGGLPNAFNLAQDELLKTILQKFKKDNRYIGAICAAPFALHTANVLNDKYTCYPSFEQKIDSSNYVENEIVVKDDKVITSKGPATAMQFALELVKILKGEESFTKVRDGLLFKAS
ncbi:DJ-1 family protein [Halarcobacter ebronensis]|uniref:DJ-1 family protein n=1 Tax=Halarcobacter ebronensis TaxID=1462615 RepID=A0A4Q0YA69_9BACT|nr:DJ-1 family glyoxalase III [Halarcobacter ebronensis]RXJ66765.1 DJ-1 family protein [Halarcobacter ebronensis]